MSAVDATTGPETRLDLPPAAPSTGRALGHILILAIPFALGAAVTSVLNLGKIALLSRVADTGALTALSLLQPAFVLILAVMEGLAITNQVFSARSRKAWPRRGVLRASRRLSVVGLIVLTGIAALSYLARYLIPADAVGLMQTVELLPGFVLSLTLFTVFDIYFGAMRGQGKILLGLLPFAGLVAIDLAVTYLLVADYGLGFEAVLLGNLAGAGAMLPVIIWLLHREVKDGAESPDEPFRIRLRQLQIGVGLPVFSSLVVGFVSAAVAFPLLARLGQDVVAAFFVVLRYRIAFMIPAIAIGSAIAILVNQAAEEGEGRTRLRYLVIGVPVMLLLYVGATLALPHWSFMLDLLVPAEASALRGATQGMLELLLVTFFLVAGGAMLQVILEQLGRGGQVLAITVLTEFGTCAALVWVTTEGATVGRISQVLIGFAALSFGLLTLQFLLLLRKMRSADAV